jgi:hypothetical protein
MGKKAGQSRFALVIETRVASRKHKTPIRAENATIVCMFTLMQTFAA